ncbi:MAG TPA: response regulator [Spirochaetia bacterium]|nr:response regulator [Spirochaetia bacterium]
MTGTECRILIADDEYWVRENIRTMLARGSTPFVMLEPAEDGEEAALRIEREHPDILITDINMPLVDGNELIRIAKKVRPQMPVIVLSGYSDFVLVRQALLCGAIDYLLKPVTQSALLEVLEKAVSILDAAKAEEKERAELKRKLAIATSLLRDETMSALVADDSSDAASSTVADLELRFAAFTLILIRLPDLPARARKRPADRAEMERTVKETVAGRISDAKAVVFHNIYSACEYIAVTDMDGAGIARACRELAEKLQRCTGSRVSIATSGSYNSFQHLQTAYQEARAAILTRPVGRGGAFVGGEGARAQVVHKRISAEMEKRLVFALLSGNRRIAREVVFEESRLRECEREGWQLIEVKLMAEYVAGMIIQHAARGASQEATLAMENIAGLLGPALEAEDVPEVCSLLEQLLDEAFGEPGPAGVSESTLDNARKVQRYIDDHYFEPLSLTSLSSQFGIERSYLSKVFTTVTGQHVMSAIAKRRIDRATRYIREDDLNLTEISSLVGYEDYAYFNRVFRKIMGISPSEYKASVRKVDSP